MACGAVSPASALPLTADDALILQRHRNHAYLHALRLAAVTHNRVRRRVRALHVDPPHVVLLTRRPGQSGERGTLEL